MAEDAAIILVWLAAADKKQAESGPSRQLVGHSTDRQHTGWIRQEAKGRSGMSEHHVLSSINNWHCPISTDRLETPIPFRFLKHLLADLASSYHDNTLNLPILL